MSSNTLRIQDQEYLFAEKVMLGYLEILQEAGEKYIKLLETLSSHALQVPEVNQQLLNMRAEMLRSIVMMQDASDSITGRCRDFITTIDEKDNFLY